MLLVVRCSAMVVYAPRSNNINVAFSLPAQPLVLASRRANVQFLLCIFTEPASVPPAASLCRHDLRKL